MSGSWAWLPTSPPVAGTAPEPSPPNEPSPAPPSARPSPPAEPSLSPWLQARQAAPRRRLRGGSGRLGLGRGGVWVPRWDRGSVIPMTWDDHNPWLSYCWLYIYIYISRKGRCQVPIFPRFWKCSVFATSCSILYVHISKEEKKHKIVKKTLKTTYFWGPGGVPLSLSLSIYIYIPSGKLT